MGTKQRALTILTILALGGLLVVPAGCGGSGGGDGSGGGSISVLGVVLDDKGAPRGLVPVVVSGRVTFSDESGEFRAAGVSTPYDVVLLDPVAPRATVYLGLTIGNPRLPMIREWREHHADIIATVSGGAGYPLPVNHESGIAFAGPSNLDCRGSIGSINGDVSASSVVTPGNFPGSHYDGGPSWSGSIDNVMVYQALQWLADANGKVVNFTGQATGLAAIAAGAPTLVPPIVLSPIGTHEVSGTYTLPAGFTLDEATLFVETGALLSYKLPGDPTAGGGSFSARAPSIGNAVYTAQVEAWSGDFVSQARSTVPENAPPVQLDLQPANTTLSPLDGATGITHDTVFSFTPSGFGVHAVQFTGSGRANYFIVTAGTEVRIPDLRTYGITLPADTLLFWSVHSWGPYDSVDDLATTGSFRAPTPVSYFTRTDVPSFVTAP